MDTFSRSVARIFNGSTSATRLPRGKAGRDAYFEFYRAYQQEASPAERFYGMHMDIEPHQLKEWEEDNANTVQGYCDFVKLARQEADRDNSLLEVDIPCWFDPFRNQEGMNLLEFCLHNADTTLLMSYRDSARGAVDFAKTGLELARKLDRRLALALETGRIYEDVNITFDHLGTLALDREMAKLRQIVNDEYDLKDIGYAVHHYNSWVELPEEGHPPGEDFPRDNPNYADVLEKHTSDKKQAL